MVGELTIFAVIGQYLPNYTLEGDSILMRLVGVEAARMSQDARLRQRSSGGAAQLAKRHTEGEALHREHQ